MFLIDFCSLPKNNNKNEEMIFFLKIRCFFLYISLYYLIQSQLKPEFGGTVHTPFTNHRSKQMVARKVVSKEEGKACNKVEREVKDEGGREEGEVEAP